MSPAHERMFKVQYWLTVFGFVMLSILVYTLNHAVNDLRSLQAQVADNKSEILKLHLDVLQTAVNNQKANKAPSAEPGTGR